MFDSIGFLVGNKVWVLGSESSCCLFEYDCSFTYCFFIFFPHGFISCVLLPHLQPTLYILSCVQELRVCHFFLFSCECTFLSSRNFHFVISAVPDSHRSYDNRFPLSAYVARRLRVGRRLSHLSVAILKQSSLSQTYFVFEKELQFQ